MNEQRKAAEERVNATPELEPYRGVLLAYDWPEGAEHLQWVAGAPLAEVLEWCRAVDVTPAARAVKVGDFVKVKGTTVVGYVAELGTIPYGAERLPAVTIELADGRREVVAIDEDLVILGGAPA